MHIFYILHDIHATLNFSTVRLLSRQTGGLMCCNKPNRIEESHVDSKSL